LNSNCFLFIRCRRVLCSLRSQRDSSTKKGLAVPVLWDEVGVCGNTH